MYFEFNYLLFYILISYIYKFSIKNILLVKLTCLNQVSLLGLFCLATILLSTKLSGFKFPNFSKNLNLSSLSWNFLKTHIIKKQYCAYMKSICLAFSVWLQRKNPGTILEEANQPISI